MKIREIYCKRWILRKRIKAITLYPFIFYQGKNPLESLRRHEWYHIKQIRDYGVVRFYLVYLWYSIRYGYRNNPFEVEARNHEHV